MNATHRLEFTARTLAVPGSCRDLIILSVIGISLKDSCYIRRETGLARYLRHSLTRMSAAVAAQKGAECETIGAIATCRVVGEARYLVGSILLVRYDDRDVSRRRYRAAKLPFTILNSS